MLNYTYLIILFIKYFSAIKMKTINVAAMNRMDHDDVKEAAPREK